MENIIIVINFVVVLVELCRLWSLCIIKQYKKQNNNKLNLKYSLYLLNDKTKIELVGIGNDNNGDYDVSQAIKKIDMPNNRRIKI